VLRVDVGMSAGCGDGEPEVLEVLGDAVVRRLTEGGAPEVLAGPAVPPQQPHAPHHLRGPAVDTPSGQAWAEALQRLREALGGAPAGPPPPPPPHDAARRPEPTPS
jgi:hypothetical protein